MFSQSHGYTPIRQSLQLDSIDQPLRNGLWTVLYSEIFRRWEHTTWLRETERLGTDLWVWFFKDRIDSLPSSPDIALDRVRDFFLTSQWYLVFDLIEFVVARASNSAHLCDNINYVLRAEMSGYRLVAKQFCKLTADEEIEAIEAAEDLRGDLALVSQHIRAAVQKLSDRNAPDYRNSIKESISAVESICRLVTGEAKFGEAMKTLEKKGIALHPALNQAFSKLYGYTSDAEGIRHALLDKDVLDLEDAKFMLVVCSAFVNLVRARAL